MASGLQQLNIQFLKAFQAMESGYDGSKSNRQAMEGIAGEDAKPFFDVFLVANHISGRLAKTSNGSFELTPKGEQYLSATQDMA